MCECSPSCEVCHDQIVSHNCVRQVYCDYDSYMLGKIRANVFAERNGVVVADFESGLSGLNAEDIRDLRSVCDELIRRCEDPDDPPIFQAMS